MPPIIADKYKLIDKYKFQFIEKVGAELEGGWEKQPSFQIAGDGSVRCRGNVLGEYRTVPADNVTGLLKEISEKYPDDIDESCGFHIHASLKPLHMSYLSHEDFFKYFLVRMGNVGKYLRNSGNKNDYERFLHRFGGKNQYCARKFNPADQIYKRAERRTMINFCSYRTHKTVECRMLPMFELVRNAKMAAFEYVDTIESFVKEHKEPTKFKISIELPEDYNEIVKEETCV